MFSLRPATIFLFIFALTAVLFSSCTITQRRYRSGFHVEWKHRLKGQESVQAHTLQNTPTIIESADADTAMNQVTSVRPTEAEPEKSAAMRREDSQEQQISDYSPRHQKIEVHNLSRQNAWNREAETNTIVKENLQKQSRSDRNGWVVLLGVLFSLAVLIIPPILFSVGAYWLDVSALGLVFIWIIWIAGIVAALFLFSGLWPIILSCLIWNIVYTMIVGIIVLATV